jgi:hypothetical protein
MGIDTEQLRRHFRNRSLPLLLEGVFGFASEHEGEWFSGHLELSDSEGADAAQELWGHVKGAAETYGDELRRLALFAQDGDGSKYALWFHAEQPGESAPVVYINSEGEDSLLTSNVADFLALLRLDRDDVGMFPTVARDPDSDHAQAHEAYLDWANKNGVPGAPTDVEALLRNARAQHPDFASWYLALKEKIWALE